MKKITGKTVQEKALKILLKELIDFSYQKIEFYKTNKQAKVKAKAKHILHRYSNQLFSEIINPNNSSKEVKKDTPKGINPSILF